MIGQRRRANLVLYPRNKSAERLHNLNCRENVQMARIADKVKRVANFLGLYLRKMGYSYFLGLKVYCDEKWNRRLLPFLLLCRSPVFFCAVPYTHTHTRTHIHTESLPITQSTTERAIYRITQHDTTASGNQESNLGA